MGDGQQTYLLPWEMRSPVQPDHLQPDHYRRHPVSMPILTGVTLLAVGLIVVSLVSGLLWTPWQIHAFQATTDGELLSHGIQDLVFIIFGFPLTLCILGCGHVAALLLWSEVPLPRRPKGSARIPLGTKFGAWARAAGGARVTLFVVFLLSLAFAYSTIVVEGFHVVWRIISPETI